jgi:hypothetical protein
MKELSTMRRTGHDLLHDPRFNKGTAFTAAERRKYGLQGLLPAAMTQIELQVARRDAEIRKLDDDLQKYLVLSIVLGGGDVGSRLLHASRLHTDGGRGLPEVRSHLPLAAGHAYPDQRAVGCVSCSETGRKRMCGS